MPGYWNIRTFKRTWAQMDRYARKQWHRMNELRALRGQPPLKKP